MSHLLTPCAIPSNIEDNLSRLEESYFMCYSTDPVKNKEIKKELRGFKNFKNEKRIISNCEKMVRTVKKARTLLPEEHHSLFRYCLVPKSGRATFEGNRIGGLPDFRGALAYKASNAKESINQIWPFCPCCSRRMIFFGQFDFNYWGLPIHALTGVDLSKEKDDIYDIYSSFGSFQLHQSHSIFKSKMFLIFGCFNCDYRYPGYDSKVLIAKKYNQIGDEPKKKVPRPNPSDYPEDIRLFLPTKDAIGFSGLEFKIELELSSYAEQKKVEKILEKNKDVFYTHGSDYKFFGYPESQQIPKRYHSTNHFAPQLEMTPFLSFYMSDMDYTVQLYADVFWSDGFEIYCKIDGSCT